MLAPSLGGGESNAYAMDKTPSALSIGQRVLHRGYSFIWIKGKKPCFILPQDGVAVISVGRNCPYYDKDTVVYDYNDERLPEVCGIRIQLGEEEAEACPVPSFAVPAVSSGSAETSAPPVVSLSMGNMSASAPPLPPPEEEPQVET